MEENKNKSLLEEEMDQVSDRLAVLLYGFETNMDDEQIKVAIDSVLELNNMVADLVMKNDLNIMQTLYISMYSAAMIMKMFTGNVESEEMKEARKDVMDYVKNLES